MRCGRKWYRKVAVHVSIYLVVAAFIWFGLDRFNSWREMHDWQSQVTFYLFQVLPENQAFFLAEKLGTVDVLSCGSSRTVFRSVGKSTLFNSPYIQSLEMREGLANCRLETEFPNPQLSISEQDHTGLDFEPSFEFPKKIGEGSF